MNSFMVVSRKAVIYFMNLKIFNKYDETWTKFNLKTKLNKVDRLD